MFRSLSVFWLVLYLGLFAYQNVVLNKLGNCELGRRKSAYCLYHVQIEACKQKFFIFVVLNSTFLKNLLNLVKTRIVKVFGNRVKEVFQIIIFAQMCPHVLYKLSILFWLENLFPLISFLDLLSQRFKTKFWHNFWGSHFWKVWSYDLFLIGYFCDFLRNWLQRLSKIQPGLFWHKWCPIFVRLYRLFYLFFWSSFTIIETSIKISSFTTYNSTFPAFLTIVRVYWNAIRSEFSTFWKMVPLFLLFCDFANLSFLCCWRLCRFFMFFKLINFWLTLLILNVHVCIFFAVKVDHNCLITEIVRYFSLFLFARFTIE